LITDDGSASDGGRSLPVRGLDRRQLLRAGAWATPVVLIAAATPAASASPIPAVPIEIPWAGVHFRWEDPDTTGVPSRLQVVTTVQVSARGETPPGRDVTQLMLSLRMEGTDGFSDALLAAVPVFVSTPSFPWTHLATTANGAIITFDFLWTGTLNTAGVYDTGTIDFYLSALPGTNLMRFEPIAFTLTTSSPDATTAIRHGAVTTRSDELAPGFTTLVVPTTAATTDVAVAGNNARIQVSGTVSEAATVTALLLIAPTPGSTAGTWQQKVNGSNDGSKSRRITVNAQPGQPTVFDFPTYQGVKGSSYTFLIIYNWGPNGEFQQATTGSFTIAH